MASENWSAVAAEVAAAIADIGTPVTLRRPGALPATPYAGSPAADTDYTVLAVPDMERIRDKSGTLIGVTRETLMVGATDVAPAKGDRVMVRGSWREVDTVDILWQGGVSILYTLNLVA